jgi:hypothetical protein
MIPAAPPRFRIRVPVLGDPQEDAARDVSRYYYKLRSIAVQPPPKHHEMALSLMHDWRMYCVERNVSRWPDGLYHLVDRSYQPWRGHVITFTGEELDSFDLREWDRRAIRAAYLPGIVPLASDCFQYRPRRRLASYAEIIGRMSVQLDTRASGAGGAS